MRKLAFISLLVVVIGIYFTVNAFADFYVIPVKKYDFKVTSNIVPKTGETQCYKDDGIQTGTCPCGREDCSAGQDGDLQKGYVYAVVTPSNSTPYTVPNWTGNRFTDNKDGTVTDNLTSLIWLKKANYKNTAGETGTAAWADALAFCNALQSGQCGLTDGSSAGDWRLPNFNELRSLVDPSGETGPCLPSGYPFTNVFSAGFYWSSTTFASATNQAWFMDMGDGIVWVDDKYYTYYVWPVRSGN